MRAYARIHIGCERMRCECAHLSAHAMPMRAFALMRYDAHARISMPGYAKASIKGNLGVSGTVSWCIHQYSLGLLIQDNKHQATTKREQCAWLFDKPQYLVMEQFITNHFKTDEITMIIPDSILFALQNCIWSNAYFYRGIFDHHKQVLGNR